MNEEPFILGVDIGSVAVSLVEMSLDGEILNIHYSFHNGDILNTLRSLLEAVEYRLIKGIASTASSPPLLEYARSYDSRIAFIAAAKKNHPDVGAILVVGGEKFSLISFDNDGNYRDLKTNTSCAAGTGSFLDQQARRLNLSGSAELSEMALQNKILKPVGDGLPKIASRCAVFAKTDIMHAQQTGYSLPEICDGLCLGLANNIADVLVNEEDMRINRPIVFCGGVAKNKAVVNHLEKRIGKTLVTDNFSNVYGAVGACLLLLDDIKTENINLNINALPDLISAPEEEKEYFYEPLSLKLSEYPDFESHKQYLYPSNHTGPANPVEVDIYTAFAKSKKYPVYLGFDIGSTSSKAVLMDTGREVLAGFYTRTAGRPIEAVQAILETIDHMIEREAITLEFIAAGTTGAGRKFAGQILGADIILDEITAHARAAYELNPETDTIIEIGGQDAKFTTLRNGLVTFSQMNTVCAAGTGSFIEEQAEKLDVPLSEFSARAEGVRSPLVSDRCTVFMERDINRLLNKNYPVNEILAACLFAVRENYLLKVATEGNIGEHICFQGATAKNKALAAAFEQKLQKPIYVSKYCHLTGALGVTLTLAEKKHYHSTFRGVEIHKEKIPVRTENCDLCRNHCRIRIASVKNEEVAYGFLCGRDYNTHCFVDKNRSGFDLLKERARIFRIEPPLSKPRFQFTVGIPAALHLHDDLPFWKFFFKELSIPVVTSEGFDDSVGLGKKLAGAEFCAPMHAIHGHARYLSEKADCLFMPIYLEDWQGQEKESREHPHRRRQFCYYTQFSSSVVSLLEQEEKGTKAILPLVGYTKYPINNIFVKRELLRSLNRVLPEKLSFLEISRAYDRAAAFFREGKEKMVDCFRANEKKSMDVQDIRVVLVGRPYTVLSPLMNKGIPGIFASLGIKTYFQDMLPFPHPGEEEALGPLLNACHWKFAARVLEAAEFAADTEGLYPVYITSFKCAPDSFTIEYFKRILDAKGKPYLILQLDEHDSNVGYETRIEAGVRAFRNHAAAVKTQPAHPVQPLPVNPSLVKDLSGKVLLFPNWDPITGPLLVANLRRAGINARLLEETDAVIRQSMRMNTGQCIPVNAITLEFIQYIERNNLDPADCVLWMINSSWACNLGMYPYYIKSLLEAHGNGMDRASVYAGEVTHLDISPIVTIHAYFAYLFGGLIRKIGCRIRPYETRKGETDRAIKKAIEIFITSFLEGRQESYLEAVKESLALFDKIEYIKTNSRPKVAIFGDLYMRDNDVINQDLIHAIEDAGGEVVTTPYNEYVKIVSSAGFKRLAKEGRFINLVKYKSLMAAVEFLEKRFFAYFERYVGKPMEAGNIEAEEILSRFNVRIEHDGESQENLLKLFHILREHPDVSLFVQTNPAFCCPSLITEAMARDIERVTGVPIVTLTYDGTGTPVNDRVIPYLKFAKKNASGEHVARAPY